MSVCPCSLSGQQFKKYSTKTANTLISPSAKGAVKLSLLMPRFPSTLIKEEIALEEAMMTKGLLIVQRPLYRAHILHKNIPSVCASHSLSQQKMECADCHQGYSHPWGRLQLLRGEWKACVKARLICKTEINPLIEFAVTPDHHVRASHEN